MEFHEILILNFVVVGVPLLALWGLSIRLKNVSIIDVFWGPSYALVALASLWAGGDTEPRRLLLAVLVIVWGGRLGIYLGWRSWG